jgi:HAD superfamily hydrolase (TIGR01509 family)
MQNFNSVIFDMDGVLVDSEKHWENYQYKFISSIVTSWDEHNHRRLLGMSIKDIHLLLTQEFGLKMDFVEFSLNQDTLAKEVYLEKTALYPGVLELLGLCKDGGKKTAICSSSSYRWINAVVERFGLGQYFDLIVSAEAIDNKSKPFPDVYVHTLKELNSLAGDSMAIEDSKNGIMAAKGAGIYCYGYLNGFNKKEDLEEADCIITCLTDFLVKN